MEHNTDPDQPVRDQGGKRAAYETVQIPVVRDVPRGQHRRYQPWRRVRAFALVSKFARWGRAVSAVTR